MKRDFSNWLACFKQSICDYDFYVNFSKVYRNIEEVKVELNIMNSLIGSHNVEEDFSTLASEYPKIIRCIPYLLAVRGSEIYAIDADGEFILNFKKINYNLAEYSTFMRKTGLFELISNKIINNLVDYVTGVEVGLDSNARKNRGGHLMENLVESYLKQNHLQYYKEMYLRDIEKQWNIDLSKISNQGKTAKRFDFVVKSSETIFAIETNFYSGGGSKLNETARSYKNLAIEAQSIKGFAFVWFTDGVGWKSARHNLEETFDVMENLYCIKDLENGIMETLFKDGNETQRTITTN